MPQVLRILVEFLGWVLLVEWDNWAFGERRETSFSVDSLIGGDHALGLGVEDGGRRVPDLALAHLVVLVEGLDLATEPFLQVKLLLELLSDLSLLLLKLGWSLSAFLGF